MKGRAGSATGTTLVEVLVAVVILGTAFVAILGGMATSLLASDIHRKEATAETILRSYAEGVKKYIPWNGCSTTKSSYSPTAVGFSDFDATAFTPSVVSVSFYDGAASPPWPSSCTTDPGLQKVKLQVVSRDARATESVEILKRRP